MYRYFIKSLIVLLVCSSSVLAQTEDTETATDTTAIQQKYGLRLGADISKLVRSAIDDDYQGFEINGDYRLTQRLYIAGELGNEQRTLSNDFLNSTAKGSYFKAGVDYNLYRNWLDMENMIYSGFRVGVSSFSQTLNSYTIYDVNNQYFGQQFEVTNPEEFDGLSAIWGEIILGIKAEVLNNLFMGLNLQLKFLVSETSPDNFENLYIPGFNRTYDSGIVGAGFGYNISYLIPIYKKDKVIKRDEDDAEEETEENN
ncbi:DUF6048 family protein [Winogradskyella jejuensis]|uniref:Outer membrane protein beta-barrel domain-containing protein n=1 Tax=Winogradskyella jejuensis TaxID=1089305 RepID=A0A1M5TDL6_9FLAO|nr:DUF6048 family protein [Winogradskyella jejuensis]SHH48905.1 hypothetical protein SAMN05444148_2135 [Winogradskyella jejuensis]